jgi:hypothetical protein
MDQLKQALMKAGLKATKPKPEEPKEKKKSLSPQKEAKKFNEDQVRSDCEYCKKYKPDVEYYRHNNKFVEVRWLCMKCADEYKILDECRQTHQSTDARSGRFIRQYGPTKKF